jgi:hypothetical protein
MEPSNLPQVLSPDSLSVSFVSRPTPLMTKASGESLASESYPRLLEWGYHLSHFSRRVLGLAESEPIPFAAFQTFT